MSDAGDRLRGKDCLPLVGCVLSAGLACFIHEFRGPTASEPDFMQCLAQFQVPYKNDSVSNGLPATVAADPHFRWLA